MVTVKNSNNISTSTRLVHSGNHSKITYGCLLFYSKKLINHFFGRTIRRDTGASSVFGAAKALLFAEHQTENRFTLRQNPVVFSYYVAPCFGLSTLYPRTRNKPNGEAARKRRYLSRRKMRRRHQTSDSGLKSGVLEIDFDLR